MKQKTSKNKLKLIIFDIDGVLVDVIASYRVAIKKTAEFFLGKMLTMDDVQSIKNQGVSNDYDATELLIKQNGGDFRRKVIIKKFQEYYLGKDFGGLIKNEKLLVKPELIKKLGKKYSLAIFTGRPRIEANFVLDRFKIKKYFKDITSLEDVKEEKPSPEGLLKILKKTKAKNAETIYIGDNLADLRAAKNANINFIGIVDKNVEDSKAFMKSEGADIILNNVNDIIKVIK